MIDPTRLLAINVRTDEDLHLIELEGEIDASSAKDLDGTLSELSSGQGLSIIIDMERVGYISSAGIGLFIYYSGDLQKRNLTFALARPNPVVREILELVTLEQIMPITATLEEALDLARSSAS